MANYACGHSVKGNEELIDGSRGSCVGDRDARISSDATVDDPTVYGRYLGTLPSRGYGGDSSLLFGRTWREWSMPLLPDADLSGPMAPGARRLRCLMSAPRGSVARRS